MVRLIIDLPDDVRDKLSAMAERAGQPSLEAFLRAKLTSEVDEDHGAPPHLSVASDEQMERLLLDRMDDPRPSIEVGADFWQDMKRRVLGERGKGG